MRSLWIIRINAAARQHGLSYNQFVAGCKKAEIELDRKVLAELAVSDPDAFGMIAEQAKSALGVRPVPGDGFLRCSREVERVQAGVAAERQHPVADGRPPRRGAAPSSSPDGHPPPFPHPPDRHQDAPVPPRGQELR